MTEIVDFPNERVKIVQEACDWLSRLDSEELTTSEKEELSRWVTQSDIHKNELTRLAGIWDNIEGANLKDIPISQQEDEPIGLPIESTWCF